MKLNVEAGVVKPIQNTQWSIFISLLQKMKMLSHLHSGNHTWILSDGGHRAGDWGICVCRQRVCRRWVRWQKVLELDRNRRSMDGTQIIMN